jgi:hypothetical protein
MDILNDDTIRLHQEFIRREANINLALKQSGMVNPTLAERILPALGDFLCRVGTRLKQHSYHRLASEESSAPTYLIIL